MSGRRRDERTADAASDFAELATAEPIALESLGRLRLLVFGEDTFVTHTLPPLGVVSIGRGEQANIRIEDASISRLHAKIHIGTVNDANALFVEDLGSSNGTKIRGRPLVPGERRAISAGEVVDVGQTMIIVQHSATQARPRRFVAHGYFELRLEEECARARAAGRTFAVIRVRTTQRVEPQVIEDAISAALRPFDLVARYAPSEYELLYVDSTREQAAELATALEVALEERDVEVKTSIALYPEDGRDPEALVARAGARVRGSGGERAGDGVIIVQNSAMQQIYRLLDRVAPSGISVLVLGETGVGKEVIAEAVHRRSQRSERELLRLNCAALTESLLESELFGHEKGAFSGAIAAKPGLLETAHGGTVFLDEIGELPLSTQAKLLRVIEERKVRRVGSVEARPIDVRFVAATNRDLEEEIARGGFRRDLFYRLNGISIVIPPLRERVEEIAPLAESFAARAARELGLSAPAIAPPALALLEAYSWPGNIRELKNVIDRAVILADRGEITPEHLPMEKLSASVHRAPPADVAPVPLARGASSIRPETPLRDEIEELERRRIMEALEKCGGVQTKAAKMLGWSRGTFLARLEAYDIPRKRKDKTR